MTGNLFDGTSYDPQVDHDRLLTLQQKVMNLMLDYRWRTLTEIQRVTGGSEAGISARLRDLRKKRFGGYVVERRRRGAAKRGLYEYRVLLRRDQIVNS